MSKIFDYDGDYPITGQDTRYKNMAMIGEKGVRGSITKNGSSSTYTIKSGTVIFLNGFTIVFEEDEQFDLTGKPCLWAQVYPVENEDGTYYAHKIYAHENDSTYNPGNDHYMFYSTGDGFIKYLYTSEELKKEIKDQSGSYTLPVASESKLGGVKPVAKTDSMVQSVGVDSEGKLYTTGSGNIYNANLYGVTRDNTGVQNSQALQSLIDKVSEVGRGTIYIPAGTYVFGANGKNTSGDRCVKIKNNVRIIGDGLGTILKPTGSTNEGLDMFYFNDYLDTGAATYLENCIFEDFVIDGADSEGKLYTSSGKGFMINLFKNCHWKNVLVKNTDGTGFGVDCPIDSSMENCVAINCGKAATQGQPGASGFGIGFGYSQYENMHIYACRAEGNKNFGFFFEHQRRFRTSMYKAASADGLICTDCISRGNYYNFGAIHGISVIYRNCISLMSNQHGYYLENSNNCNIVGCYSVNEVYASYTVVASDVDDAKVVPDVKDIFILSCISKYTNHGIAISNKRSEEYMERIMVKGCVFSVPKYNNIHTEGTVKELYLIDNTSTKNTNEIGTVTTLVEKGNSWNDDSGSNTV